MNLLTKSYGCTKFGFVCVKGNEVIVVGGGGEKRGGGGLKQLLGLSEFSKSRYK